MSDLINEVSFSALQGMNSLGTSSLTATPGSVTSTLMPPLVLKKIPQSLEGEAEASGWTGWVRLVRGERIKAMISSVSRGETLKPLHLHGT
jgi:hypothetical protein